MDINTPHLAYHESLIWIRIKFKMLSVKNQPVFFCSIAGLLIGLFAWLPLGITGQLGILWFLVFAWLLSKNRKAAFVLMFSYYLATGREVPEIIHRFTGDPLQATWPIVIACSAVVAGMWALAWHPSKALRFGGLVLLLALTSLTPVGAFIYGSPLVAAGWLFPGTGFWGLGLLVASWGIAFWLLTSESELKNQKLGIVAITGVLVVAVFMNLNYKEPEFGSIYALHTQVNRYPDKIEDRTIRHTELTNAAMKALEQPFPIIVMPEEIAGIWEVRYDWMWQDVGRSYKDAGKTLIVGFDTKPDGYSNTAIAFGQHAKTIEAIRARISAPIASWYPWNSTHIPIRWTESTIRKIGTQDLAFIFCWEELVPWPWLSIAWNAEKPPLIVIMVNHWWAQNLDIGDSQARSSEAWARLFGWSYQRVVNEL